jgi:hypothetical protein
MLLRQFPILLALLAWVCLASPWQSCQSDCREGALQPVGHGCHPKAEEKHRCHCSHASGHETVIVGDTSETGGATHQCEDGVHLNIVFQQVEPEDEIVLGDPVPDPPLFAPVTIRHCVDWAPVVLSAVDPPGPEPQRMRQLRVDVLLL